jgi:hypothetical protein
MVRALRIATRPNSKATRAYLKAVGRAEAIAPGIAPKPAYDLVDHGGKTMPALTYVNYYLGRGWSASDIQAIDRALAAAMTDRGLNEIMSQYFRGASPTSAAGASQTLNTKVGRHFDQRAVDRLVTQLLSKGAFDSLDLSSTVVNFLLPPKAILVDSSGPQKLQGLDQDAADSLNGLGGYHGSVHVENKTVYYAVGVYSETMGNGKDNGIVAFDVPWKNVVATFYHELNEARSDSDIDDAIAAGNDASASGFLGWISPQGDEVGDEPVFETGADLSLVFKEIPLADGSGTVPIQLLWSNRVHGPEAPAATTAAMH